jgi:hypothetical protein
VVFGVGGLAELVRARARCEDSQRVHLGRKRVFAQRVEFGGETAGKSGQDLSHQWRVILWLCHAGRRDVTVPVRRMSSPTVPTTGRSCR